MAPRLKPPKRAFVPSATNWFSRHNAILIWWLALIWLIGFSVYPVNSGVVRCMELLLSGLLAIGLLAIWWRYPILRWALLSVYVGAGIFTSLPGQPVYDRLALREETARALRRYDGVRYYWGGKNFFGIDCSGLVRRGALDAMLLCGVRTANPLLIRKGAWLWWHDMSANHLGHGASGLAEKLFSVRQIAGMDESKLHPGDFAITSTGVHALAYLGNSRWIEADPMTGKVIQVDARTVAHNVPWFDEPMLIMRWFHLEMEKAVGRRNP